MVIEVIHLLVIKGMSEDLFDDYYLEKVVIFRDVAKEKEISKGLWSEVISYMLYV